MAPLMQRFPVRALLALLLPLNTTPIKSQSDLFRLWQFRGGGGGLARLRIFSITRINESGDSTLSEVSVG